MSRTHFGLRLAWVSISMRSHLARAAICIKTHTLGNRTQSLVTRAQTGPRRGVAVSDSDSTARHATCVV